MNDVKDLIIKQLPKNKQKSINKQYYCENFTLNDIRLDEYKSDKPYIIIKEQSPRTAETFNLYIYNQLFNKKLKIFSVTVVEGDEDYLVVTILNHGDDLEHSEMENDEYGILFDAYKIKYSVGLLTYYDMMNDLDCKPQIIHQRMMNEFKELENDILYTLKTITHNINKDNRIDYSLWKNAFEIYINLFTSALLLKLVKYNDFGKPFGDKNFSEHIFTNIESFYTKEENIDIIINVLTTIDDLYVKLFYLLVK